MLNNQETIMPVLVQDLGVLYANNESKFKFRHGLYECQCGNIFKTRITSITHGNTKSCGCVHKKAVTSHNNAYHPLYQVWNGINNRCNNIKTKSYADYGARGITVCERWKDISNFIEDMYPTYQEGLSIDRIDVNGNYEPSNCRWATKEVQSRNTRILMLSNTSGYRGVSYKKDRDRWSSRISINGKNKHIGYFKTALEAAKAYDVYVINNNLEHTINGV